MADDTLTDIHAAVGDLLDAPDVGLLDDDAIDAELDAKHSSVADDVAAETAPEPVAPEPPAETTPAPAEEAPDPLANAKAFDYTVDGTAKAYEGIRVVANADGTIQGAIIQPDALKDVQYRFQRGEYLEGQNKALYEKVRDFDRVSVTTHRGETLTGMSAIQHYAAEHAKLTAVVQLMAGVLEDPEKLTALYADPREMQLLTREVGLTARDAERVAREQFATQATQARAQESQTQDRTQVTAQAIDRAVGEWAKQFPALTPEDTQKAVAYFTKIGTHIVRPATPDEATAAGVKPGELIIDHPVLYEYLSDRAELRTQATASTAAASTAAKENAARLARAVSPKGKPPTKATRQTVPDDREETWAQQRARLTAGIFSDDD